MNQTPTFIQALINQIPPFQPESDESNPYNSFSRLLCITVQASEQIIYAKISKEGG
jgi:hypothetical protein